MKGPQLVGRRVPFMDLGAQHRPLSAALTDAFERVLQHGRFVLGPEVAEFEANCAALLGVPHAVGVSSGSDALVVALLALGVGPGDEVITTPFTFFATVESILRVGASPVFVDIDESTMLLDVKRVEAACSERTRVVLPVHLFGQLVDMDPLRQLCDRRGLWLVEDCAQAFGARRAGFAAGAVGDLGCFSFFPAKPLGGFGDGGLVTCRAPALAERVRALRVHGALSVHEHEHLGGNFRLDALQAALLGVKLPHLLAYNRARRERAAVYSACFAALNLAGDRLIWPAVADVADAHVFSQYTVRVQDRTALRHHLGERGVDTAVYYPRPAHLQPCLAGDGYEVGDYPVAELAARQVLSLPIYPELPLEDVRYVADCVRSWLLKGP